MTAPAKHGPALCLEPIPGTFGMCVLARGHAGLHSAQQLHDPMTPALPQRLILTEPPMYEDKGRFALADEAHPNIAGRVFTLKDATPAFAAELVRRWNSHAELLAFVEKWTRALGVPGSAFHLEAQALLAKVRR